LLTKFPETTTAYESSAEADGATWSIFAHRLLNTMATVVTSARMLNYDWERLEPAERQLLLGMLMEKAELAGAVIDDLARGLYPVDQLDLRDR
jgi:hypothetical protein